MKKNFLLLLVSLLSVALFSCGNSNSSEKEQAMEMLQASVDEINKVCPGQVDEITTWVSSAIEEPYFVYHYSISDQDIEGGAINTLEENSDAFRDVLKEGLKEAINSDNTKDLLIKAGLGVRYHYTSATTPGSIDFDFSPEEIATM